MKSRFFFSIGLLTLLILCGNLLGQIVRDIKPMKSTCADVAKLFGIKTCEKYDETYDLKEEKVFVTYSIELCPKAYLRYWRVPVGTVTSVIRIPKRRITISESGIDLTKCERGEGGSDVPNTAKYHCESLGLTISTYEGYVSQVIYTPTPEDIKLYSVEPACCNLPKPPS